MINKILTENNKVLINVFFQNLTDQAHLNSCTALHTYIIEFNIILIIYNLIARCYRSLLLIIHRDFMRAF
jgi:hypothetical protein